MYLAISKDDFSDGPGNDELKKEIFEKLSPQAARKIMVLLNFPEILQQYLAENTDPEMKALWNTLAFFREAEKKKSQGDSSEDSQESAVPPEAAGPAHAETPANSKKPEKALLKDAKKKKKKDHSKRKKRSHAGARGVKSFPGAKTVSHTIAGLCAGASCPCNRGKLYAISPSAKVRFEAKALLEAVVHLRERLRCNECGNIFGAFLSPEVTEREVYHGATPEAAALSILARYALGIPDLRLERLQNWLGTPLSNSRQWAIALQGFLTLKPLWEHWLKSLAQCPTLMCDDAFQKVLSVQAEIRGEVTRAAEHGIGEDKIRTGIQASVVVGTNEQGHEIHAYFTGRNHQGETLEGVLKEREEGLPPPALTTDAASKASSIRPFPEKDARGFHLKASKKGVASDKKLVVHAHCLEHLRLAFEKIENNHPDVADQALKWLGAVYGNDSQAKAHSLSPEERRDFHAAHSLPILKGLRAFIDETAEEPRAEPNSDLGRTLQYARNHWPAFTEFTRTPGVALDTNACERDVYFVILHRLNSLHYQTVNGAMVGDFFMSIAATCRSHKVNPLEYLGACLDFPHLVRSSPSAWMPWNFKEALAPAKNLREKEWAELSEVRRKKGYTQLVRTRKDKHPSTDRHCPSGNHAETR